MSSAIRELSQETISVEENSIYRALNRFESMGIVKSELQQSDVGPRRRYYQLTENGISLLTKFIERNILIFELPPVGERIHAVLNKTSSMR
jgi:DNA-binding PadR family transcriptional regulator